jgi:divalent metal cation (Fe/Co/Zn/Cd) transporter
MTCSRSLTISEPMGKDYKTAAILAVLTIIYNLAEGAISVFFGYTDETLALFGFGIDSFIEVVSGIGILQMVLRIRNNPGSPVSTFEVIALRITGYGFYILSLGLAAGIVVNIAGGRRPESTFWGTVIALVSIFVMLWLVISKRKTGRALHSEPILADANCTLVCIYMSLVLLASSALYELTGFAYSDVIGAAGLIWFSVKEGRESLEKARKRSYAECSCNPGS